MTVPEETPSRRTRATALAKRLIPWVFYVLLGAFLIAYLFTVDYDLLLSVELNWWFMLLATITILVARGWAVAIWLTILRGLGAGRFSSVPTLAFVYAKSWLGRYIPGTAPWILGKIYFASRQGLSKTKLAISSLLEAGLQIVVSLVIGLAMILFDPRTAVIPDEYRWLMGIAVVFGVLVLMPPVFNRILRLLFRVSKRGSLDSASLPSWNTVLAGTTMYAFVTVLAGLAAFFVTAAVWPELSWGDAWFVIGVTSLAAAISMLAVFAPGGIGVREAILILLLSTIMPSEIALIATILLRLWSIVGDFLFLGITYLVMRVAGRTPPDIPTTPLGSDA